jgi:DNA repair protein RadA
MKQMNRGKGGRSPGLQGTGEEILRRTTHLGYFSTGSPSIDRLLGGGLRQGRVVEFFGRSNSGKTQLAMQSALFAAKAGGNPLYIDTEGGFRPERMEEMADARGWKASELLGRTVYVSCDSSAPQIEMISSMESRPATKGCRLVVVDTLTRNFTIDMPGMTNLQSRQAALDVHLSEMARDAYINSRAYLLTNRVTFGTLHDVRIGGQTVEQLVEASVRLEKSGKDVSATLMNTGENVTVHLGTEGVT